MSQQQKPRPKEVEPRRERLRGPGRRRQRVRRVEGESGARESGELMHYQDTDGDSVGRIRMRAECQLCDWSVLLPRDNARDLAEMHLVTMHEAEL